MVFLFFVGFSGGRSLFFFSVSPCISGLLGIFLLLRLLLLPFNETRGSFQFSYFFFLGGGGGVNVFSPV